MRAKRRCAVAADVGLQVAVDHQGQGTAHQAVQHVGLAVQRCAADAGRRVRHDHCVACVEELEGAGRHDQGQRKEAQALRFARVRAPANEVALAAAIGKPGRQRRQVGRPLPATAVSHDDVGQHAVQLAAQTTDEGRQAPARLQLPALRDRRAAGEDVGVGALQAEEGHLETQLQQAAWAAEVIVRGRRQKVDVACVAAQQRLHVVLEVFPAEAEAKSDAGDKVVDRGQEFVNRRGSAAQIRGEKVGTRGCQGCQSTDRTKRPSCWRRGDAPDGHNGN